MLKLWLTILLAGILGSISTIDAHTTHQRVQFETSMGPVVVELYEDKAPITVKNFLAYVNEGFYDGTIFHRVIEGFMVQGGGFTEDMTQKKTRDPIKNEAHNGLKNSVGTLAMARTRDINSATGQFFINVTDNAFLNYKDEDNYGYAVFAKVVSGMDVVKKIESVETGIQGYFRDVPKTPVIIKSAKVLEAAPVPKETPIHSH